MRIVINLFFLVINLFASNKELCVNNICFYSFADRNLSINKTYIQGLKNEVYVINDNYWVNVPKIYLISNYKEKQIKIAITYLGNHIVGNIIDIKINKLGKFDISKIDTFSTSGAINGLYICPNNIKIRNNIIDLREDADTKTIKSKCTIKSYENISYLSFKNFLMMINDDKNYTNYNVINIDTIDGFLQKVPFSNNSVIKYNNIAYYLQKTGANQESAYLLEKIIEKFPDRTVAYLNLGDAYYGLGDKAKVTQVYQTYIDQMKTKGWDKKIPKRVTERLGEKNGI